MTKQIAFLSGIPRSGSQVLCSTLNQHPSIFASTTSPVADLLLNVNDMWPSLSQALINRDPTQYPNMVNGLLQGSYKHIDKPVIIDKNRVWPRLAREVHDAFGAKPKIIFTVRNIPEILTSYILLFRRTGNSFVDHDLHDLGLPFTDKNRCKVLWEKYISHPYTSLRIGLTSPFCEKLILEYSDIVNDTQHTVDRICDFINIEKYTVDTNNLQRMDENDNFHGGVPGLHEVRPVMKKTSPPPEEVIGHELTKYYTDIQADFWKKYMGKQNTL